MKLVEQWREAESGLPAGWASVRVVLVVSKGDPERAAALLGPAQPVRSGPGISYFAARTGSGMRPDAVLRLLGRIDAEGIEGSLQLAGTREDTPAPPAERHEEPLAAAWDTATAGLPEDWSDLYAEVELDSTDYLEPGALRLAPVNPARYGAETGFRFRCARRFGYGASSGMVKRCLERLDEAGITGEVRILRVLSDTKPVGTQGPVWYVGGKAV